MIVEAVILLVILIVAFIIILFQSYTTVAPVLQNPPLLQPPLKPEIKKPKKQPDTGCEGTRYGCCPYAPIPKLNAIGSNCNYYIHKN
jgi:hypothetical protein